MDNPFEPPTDRPARLHTGWGYLAGGAAVLVLLAVDLWPVWEVLWVRHQQTVELERRAEELDRMAREAEALIQQVREQERKRHREFVERLRLRGAEF